MIAIVVGLSFIVLLLAFRSLLVPIKAAAMNLLSVAAAYGVVTAVFQLGWGSSLIGLDHPIPIVSFVPLLMFAILFGLSMDYEVFLLTQMREHYRQTGDEKEAVIEGLANTGRVITSAAAIMVCVFTSFVLNGNPIVKEFGVGLAVAIAIDSTLVRCLLVPAIMVLLGKRAWWMPGWLDRLVPHISIEGEEYFAKRDAALAAAAKSRRERLSGMFPLNLPNALTLLRILAVPVVVVALLGETPNGDALAAAVFALAALDRRARRLLRPLARRGHHLRQADGPDRRQAADRRRAGLAGLARPARSLGGDGDHRPRVRRHRDAGDRRRARHRDRRQLARQGQDRAADRRRDRPDRRQPGPGLGRRPRLPRRRRDPDQRRRLLLRPAPPHRGRARSAARLREGNQSRGSGAPGDSSHSRIVVWRSRGARRWRAPARRSPRVP